MTANTETVPTNQRSSTRTVCQRSFKLKLPQFRGHLSSWRGGGGVHDAEVETAVPRGIPTANGRAGSVRTYTGRPVAQAPAPGSGSGSGSGQRRHGLDRGAVLPVWRLSRAAESDHALQGTTDQVTEDGPPSTDAFGQPVFDDSDRPGSDGVRGIATGESADGLAGWEIDSLRAFQLVIGQRPAFPARSAPLRCSISRAFGVTCRRWRPPAGAGCSPVADGRLRSAAREARPGFRRSTVRLRPGNSALAGSCWASCCSRSVVTARRAAPSSPVPPDDPSPSDVSVSVEMEPLTAKAGESVSITGYRRRCPTKWISRSKSIPPTGDSTEDTLTFAAGETIRRFSSGSTPSTWVGNWTVRIVGDRLPESVVLGSPSPVTFSVVP